MSRGKFYKRDVLVVDEVAVFDIKPSHDVLVVNTHPTTGTQLNLPVAENGLTFTIRRFDNLGTTLTIAPKPGNLYENGPTGTLAPGERVVLTAISGVWIEV